MESNIILNSCPQFLFKAILYIIHAALRSFQTIQACALSWWRLYVSSSSLKMFDGWPSQKPCPLSLRKDVDEIQKLPRHLGIVLTEKSNASMIEDLSNLVSWAVCFGVPYISFYKNEGCLVARQDDIKKAIKTNFKQFFGDHSMSYSLIVKDSSKSYDNGYVNTRGICVQILSSKDGRQDIVNTAKNIVSQISNGDPNSLDLTASLINDGLAATKGLPDPDLVLQFGSEISLNGFLPWQCRLTEIISLPFIKNISYWEFFEALKRYGKSKQRFGK